MAEETKLIFGADVQELVTSLTNKVIPALEEVKKRELELQKVNEKLFKSGEIDRKQYEKSLEKQYKSLQKNEKATKEAKNEIIKLAKSTKQVNGDGVEDLNEELEETEKKTGLLGKSFGGLKGLIVGAFAVAGITSFVKGVFGANKEIQRTQTIAKNLGFDNFKEASSDARQIARVFDKDVNEVLKSANVLTKQFGINQQEAFDLIEEGITKGADLNEDFLDQIGEYSTQFRLAGLEADESIAIITQSVNEGVFSDKGADSIKEATIRLREFTPATRDAINAIGLDAGKVQKDLESGSKTYFEVIQDVVKETKKFGEDSQQAGQILADVFGGAGEDAGDFIFKLDEVSTNLNDIESNTGKIESAQNKLSGAWGDFIDGIFESDNVLGQFFSNALTNISSLVNAINEAVSSAEKNSQRRLRDAKKDATAVNKIFIDSIKEFENAGLDELSKERDRISKEISSLLRRSSESGSKDENDSLKLQIDILNKKNNALRFIENRNKQGLKDNIAIDILLSRQEVNAKNLSIEQDNYNKELEKTNELRETGFLSRGLDFGEELEKQRTFLKGSEKVLSDSQVEIELIDSELKKQIKKSSEDELEELKKLNNNKLNELISFEQTRRKNQETELKKSKSGIKTDNSKRIKELEDAKKSEEEFQKALSDIIDEAEKNRINNLTGEDKILAELDFRIEAVDRIEQALLEKGREAFGREFELEKEQIEQIEVLRKQETLRAEDELNQLRLKTIKEQAQKEKKAREEEFNVIDDNENLELSKSEIDPALSEQEKQQKILDIQIEYAQKRIDLLRGTGEIEDEIRANELQKVINDLETSQAELTANADKFSLSSLLNVTTEEAQGIEENFKSVVSNLVGIYSAGIDKQIQDSQRLIEQIDEDIDKQKERVDEEKDIAEDGNAYDLELEEKKLSDLEAKREVALEKQKEAQKKQEQIDTASQLTSLVTASANIFKGFSTLPLIGQVLAVASVGAMFASFAQSKIQARNVAKLEKGGSSFGVLEGNRHQTGGINLGNGIEAEGGEAWSVYNRKATRKNPKLIQAFTDAINKDEFEDFIGKFSKTSDISVMPININKVDELQKEQSEIKKKEIVLMGKSAGVDMRKVESELVKLNSKKTYGETATHYIIEEAGKTIKLAK